MPQDSSARSELSHTPRYSPATPPRCWHGVREAALQRAEADKVTRVKAAEAEAEARYLQVRPAHARLLPGQCANAAAPACSA